tara:strand:- start:2776 stop:3138 length:363 start_codon:yes stop_codon:yes gene_type:complete
MAIFLSLTQYEVAFFTDQVYTVTMAFKLTPQQRQINQVQQSRFARQQQLVSRWQARIGITDITQLGTKQLRDKQRQQHRQKRNQAILLRKQKKDINQVSNSENNVGCNIVVNDPTLGQTE